MLSFRPTLQSEGIEELAAPKESSIHLSQSRFITNLVPVGANVCELQSNDCVRAFQKAAAEDEQDEGILIRLVRQNERIKAITFDEDELATATKRQIEVR